MMRHGAGRLIGSFFFLELASAMMFVALPLLMVQRYGLGVETGLVLAVALLPQLLFAGLVRAAIQRFDARRVAIASTLASAVVVTIFPLSESILEVGALAFATGTAFLFGMPARMAMRSNVMPAGSEILGNSLIVTGERLAMTFGPALGALLVATCGIDYLFSAVAIAMLGAAMLLFGIGGTGTVYAPIEVGTWLQRLLVEPIREFRGLLRGEPLVAALTVTGFGYVTAVGASRLLLASRAQALFGVEGNSLGFLLAAMAAGGATGAMIGGRLGRLPQGRLYIVGNVCEAACWPLVALVQDRIVVVAIMFVAGLFESIPTVVYFAQVQARLSPLAVGNYYSWLIPLTQTCAMLGAIGGSALLALGGTLPLGIAMACLIGVPVLAQARILIRACPHEYVSDGDITKRMA